MQVDELVEVRTGFLTGGPSIRFRVPGSFITTPILSAPLDVGNGGGRELAFAPTALPDFTSASDLTQIRTIRGFDHRPVEVWERSDGELWFLRWRLGAGTLAVHIRRVDDGAATIERVARGLEVIEDARGIPTVIAHPPLGRGTMMRPGYLDTIRFVEPGLRGLLQDGIIRSISVARPGNASTHGRVEEAAPNVSVSRGTGTFDVSVEGRFTRDEALRLADMLEEDARNAG